MIFSIEGADLSSVLDHAGSGSVANNCTKHSSTLNFPHEKYFVAPIRVSFFLNSSFFIAQFNSTDKALFVCSKHLKCLWFTWVRMKKSFYGDYLLASHFLFPIHFLGRSVAIQ